MTTSSPTPSSPDPVKAARPAPKKVKARPGAWAMAFLLLLVELILPVLVAGGLIWYLFMAYNLWAMERSLSLMLFGAAVVVVGLVLSVVLDTLLGGLRGSLYRQGARFATGANLRMGKMALGGLILPLGLVIAANLVLLPNSGTAMNLLIELAQKPTLQNPPGEIGGIAIKSGNPATKILSIQVLQGFSSVEALNQLLQIAATDKAALLDGGVSVTLSKAIASYGLTARDSLLKIFNGIDPLVSGKSGSSATGAGSGLYERYFNNSFDSLKAEITLQVSDADQREARLAQIQAAQSGLKTALGGLEESLAANAAGDPRLAFVMHTFLVMDISQDAALLEFARASAADTRYSSLVRGDALLLIAKLGDKSDLNGLFVYLQGGDDLLQERCLQAIYNLQDKISHTVGK